MRIRGRAAHDLAKLDEPNTIFVLQLPEGFSTAGGSRGGGFGERRVLKIYQYACGHGDCRKVNEFEGQEATETIDPPYHAAAFPITLPDVREKLVSGVAGAEFVAAYRRELLALRPSCPCLSHVCVRPLSRLVS